MKIDVKVPTVGESITEGRLIAWFKTDGDLVKVDEPLFELETDKITMQVQAEQGGRLSIGVAAGSEVEIGQVVGSIDTDAKGQTAAPAPKPEAPPTERAGAATNELRLAPSVRRLVAEQKVNPREIPGTGKRGRVTKEDVMNFVAEQRSAPATPSPVQAPTPITAKPAAAPADKTSGERETRRPMSSLRMRLADRLVGVQHEAAILTTFNEVDMTRVMELRAQYQESFEKKNGVRLGFMSFFIKAAVEALQTVPALNARIDGNEIVENHFYDISVAVSTERGLIVPVVRNADQQSFAELEITVGDMAKRASEGKLELRELTGGCFTISNGGIFGSLLSTPILNPPQSGILGMHAIKKRPIVVNDEIKIRPMMYLALSYDHRLVDGREAVTFLKRIVDCVENPERLMFAV